MVVDGIIYTKDLKIFPERIISDWWRKEGHLLECEDMEDAFNFGPEVIVVGTGMMGAMRISKRVKERVKENSIELFAERTGKAVEIFNKISVVKKTVGLFHLTC